MVGADRERDHQARKRLGREVFAEIFEQTGGPVAGDTGPLAQRMAVGTARGAFLRAWRLLAIDGFELDLPDTPGNAEEFGYAGSGENRSAFCKARVVALSECGTHAFLTAEIDAYRVGEKTLAQRLYPRLGADDLLSADHRFLFLDRVGHRCRDRCAAVVARPDAAGPARHQGP